MMGLDSDLSFMLFVGVAPSIVATRSAVADAPCPGFAPGEGIMISWFMFVLDAGRNAILCERAIRLRCTLDALS